MQQSLACRTDDESGEATAWVSVVRTCKLDDLDKTLNHIPVEFRWHTHVARVVLARNGLLLRKAPRHIRDDVNLVKIAVQQNGMALRWARRLREDPATVDLAVRQSGKAIRYTSKSTRTREVCLLAVQRHAPALTRIPNKYRKDKQFVMAAVTRDGMMLKHAIYVDVDVVTTAIKQNRLAVRFVKDVSQFPDVEYTFFKDPWVLKYPCMADQVGLCLALLAQDGRNLKYASQALRQNYGVVCTAVRQNCEAFVYADPSVKDNFEFVLNLVVIWPRILGWASDRLRSLKEIVMAAVANDGMMLQHAIYTDGDVVATATKQNAKAVKFVSTKMLERLCIRQLVFEIVARNGLDLQYASQSLCENEEVVRTAVNQNWTAFEFATSSLKDNFDFVMSLVTVWPCLLRWVSTRLKANIRIVYAAVIKDYRSFVYAGQQFWQSYPYYDFVDSPWRRNAVMFYTYNDREHFWKTQNMDHTLLGSPDSVLQHVTNLLASSTTIQ